MPDALRIGVLGPLQVRDGAGQSVPIDGRQLRVLLILLALDAGRVVPVASLAGQPLADAAGCDAAEVAAARLTELHASVLADRIEADLALGEGASLVGKVRALTSADPLAERPRALLMRALYAAGRQAEALAVYHEARELLAGHLGVDPSAQLEHVYLRILRADPTLYPERALVSLPATPASPRAGQPLTSFVGRDSEVSLVLKNLGAARLVTLTGPGGVGKTRLAGEVSGHLHGPVRFVELASVTDRAEVPYAVLAQLAERLDDRFAMLTGGSRTALPRHRTLRAVVDWSWDLLAPPRTSDFGPPARDFGPWVGEVGVRLTGAVFVSAETVVNVGFDVARARLAGLAGGWLAGASGDAYAEGGRGLARVGPAGSFPGLSRLVEVRFRDLVAHEGSAVMALRWEAAGAGGALFPVLDADLRLTPREESPRGEPATTVAVVGVYRPPLGALGAALDRAGLRLVAAATVREFVNRVGEAVADPVEARVPEFSNAAVRWSRIPLAPGEA